METTRYVVLHPQATGEQFLPMFAAWVAVMRHLAGVLQNQTVSGIPAAIQFAMLPVACSSEKVRSEQKITGS